MSLDTCRAISAAISRCSRFVVQCMARSLTARAGGGKDGRQATVTDDQTAPGEIAPDVAPVSASTNEGTGRRSETGGG